METPSASREELRQLLSSRFSAFSALGDEDRERVLDMVEVQIARGLPHTFIWSGVRSTCDLLLDTTDHSRTREVQRFLDENASSLRERQNPRAQPRREAKQRARERLLESTRGLLREARAAKQPHERKKMRRTLLGLDQAHLLRTLGRDGQELCHQINEYLSRSHDLR